MKYFTWIISAINIYMGLRFFLNAVHVLQTSKYAQSSNVVFAILFLTMGIGAFYLSIAKKNDSIALLLSVGPWVLAVLFLLFNMLASDYK
ncbi:MAG: hypothetical protein ABIR18_12715 [Chitinophagaceae bacterium]